MYFPTVSSTVRYCFQHTSEYEAVLKGVRGDTQTKKLASQFIARFSPQFPNLGDASLDAILDLCEDDDVTIRKQAIKVSRPKTEAQPRKLKYM